MKRVLIIEDEVRQREFLVDQAEKINSELKIIWTDSYDEAIEVAMKNTIDVFFIDVEIIGGNGLELAKELRKKQEYRFTPMVFITGMVSRELEAYKNVHCYDFISKPYTRNDIKKVMDVILNDYIETIKEEIQYLDLDFKGIKQRINMDDILYIESKNRRVIIRTRYEEIRYRYMPIRKYKDVLSEDFVQVHQAFLINKQHIFKINMNEQTIEMKNTSLQLPIGSSYKKVVGALF